MQQVVYNHIANLRTNSKYKQQTPDWSITLMKNIKFRPFYTRMLCAKFGKNWSTVFEEDL